MVQIPSPQPCCATKKDIAPESPDTRAVSGFFRAPILGCKQKDIFLCPEDLNYRPPLFQAAFERCILPKAAFFRFPRKISMRSFQKTRMTSPPVQERGFPYILGQTSLELITP